jgi:hypothetical protein
MKLIFLSLVFIASLANAQFVGTITHSSDAFNKCCVTAEMRPEFFNPVKINFFQNEVIQPGLVGDSATDNGYIIQKTIDSLYSKGGGTFFFPAGKYITSPIVCRAGVLLLAESKNNTVLILKNRSKGSLLTFVNARNAGIQNFTLDANMKGSNAEASCIVIKQDPGGNSSGLLISNNLLINAGVDGLQAYSPAYMFRVQNNDIVSAERYGIYNTSTDNEFFSNNINHGNRGGFYNSGSSTRITGGKIIGSGMYDSTSGGVIIWQARRVMIQGVEVQDNYFNGVVMYQSTLISAVNMLADGNAVAYRRDKKSAKGYGFKLTETTDSYLQGIATNYIPTAHSQAAGHYFLNCSNLVYDVIETEHNEKAVELNTFKIKTLKQKIRK